VSLQAGYAGSVAFCLIPLAAFVVYYGLRVDWPATIVGRHLMASTSALLMLMAVTLGHIITGVPRGWLWVATMTLFGCGLWAQLGLLVHAQRRAAAKAVTAADPRLVARLETDPEESP
jgi:hypothetical protein